MNRNKKKRQIYHSWAEFENKCLPKDVEKRRAERPIDPKTFGISLAKESLDRIKVLQKKR